MTNPMIIFGLMLGMLMANASFASGGGGGGEGGNFLKMDPIVVNVRVGDSSGYLTFTPQVKVKDPVDLDVVKSYTPVLRHLLLKSLVGQNAATLQTAEFIGKFSHQAAELINKVLDGDYVSDVFFDRWLIQ